MMATKCCYFHILVALPLEYMNNERSNIYRCPVGCAWPTNGRCIVSFTARFFSYKLEFYKTQSESFSHSHQISDCMIKHSANN